MADNWLIEQRIDLRRGVQAPQVWPHALMLCGDNNAHTWRVIVLDGGEPAQITGNITGYFVRADGNTVVVTGELSGHIASVTLAQACYAIEGDLRAVMRLKVGESTITLSALILHVRSEISDSIIDPGEVIPSLDDLLAQIDACEEATDAANDAADAANQAAQSVSAVESDVETAEAARVTAEQGRVAAEQARAAAEAERVANEAERQQQLTNAINAAEADADRAEAAADAAETLIAMPPLFSDTPPTDEPTLNKLWVDTGVSPTMMRRWRGADVTTEREYEATYAGVGKNLYDVNDKATFSDGVTVDADGWITVTADNSGGNNTLFRNIFTRPSAALKPDREYTIVCEIASASISVDNANLCLVNGTVSQFVTTKWLANLNAGTQVYVVKTKADFSDCESMLRTYAQYNAGASGTIKFRISVLEDTSITAETFEYEPYQDIPFLALDNAQGQIENVTVEAGCRAKQAGTGEPSPENIRAITGRDSVEIVACGKNLVPIRTTDDTLTGISYHSNGDGSYTVNGTSTGNAAYILLQTVIPPGNYVLSGGSNNVNVHVAEFNADGTWVSSIAMSVNGNAAAVTIQPLPAGHYHRINIGVDLGLQASSVTVYPQLEAGDTATAFEPYRSMGGGTVTPTEPLYGLPGAEDTVEVSVDGDVLVTRRTAVKTLDGTENWWRNAGWAIPGGASVTNILLNAKPVSGTLQIGNLQCSHLMVASANSAVNMNGSLNKVGLGQGTELFINVEGCDTVSSLKSYLADQYAAGTPVTIVYELAAPTTETPADVDPIEPQAGQLNISTDADALSATVHGSGWDTISDQTGLLATIAQLTARVTALEQAAVNSIGG